MAVWTWWVAVQQFFADELILIYKWGSWVCVWVSEMKTGLPGYPRSGGQWNGLVYRRLGFLMFPKDKNKKKTSELFQVI